LSDAELASRLKDYISDAVEYAVHTYTIGERSADFNGDGFVDMFDALILSNHFGMQAEHPDWDSKVDLNFDGVINMYDALVFSKHFQT
jgi:hypothetical protein